MRLLTWIHHFPPLLTTLHNHTSTPIFFLLLHLDQKVNLVCFSRNKNAQLARQLFWVAGARLHGSTPRTPRPAKTPLMLLVSYTQEPGVIQGASSLIPERNKHKMRFERKGAAPPCKPSLTPKPMRVNQVHRACDQYIEWACWMAGGNVIKVTVGPRGTSWLRCSASKLNTDRKPRVWYCKKIICLPARVRLANQRVCFHLKEILTTMREEGMKLCGYQKSSPPLPRLLQRVR